MKNVFKTAPAVLFLAGCVFFSACRERAGKEPTEPRAALASLRSALQAYHNDHAMQLPRSLDALTTRGQYLKDIPYIQLPGHKTTNAVIYIESGAIEAKDLTDTGGFAYYYSEKYPKTWGTVVINCTHDGSQGIPIYSY